jgi:hypothetical protein
MRYITYAAAAMTDNCRRFATIEICDVRAGSGAQHLD